jgi:hypothetical protein
MATVYAIADRSDCRDVDRAARERLAILRPARVDHRTSESVRFGARWSRKRASERKGLEAVIKATRILLVDDGCAGEQR